MPAPGERLPLDAAFVLDDNQYRLELEKMEVLR